MRKIGLILLITIGLILFIILVLNVRENFSENSCPKFNKYYDRVFHLLKREIESIPTKQLVHISVPMDNSYDDSLNLLSDNILDLNPKNKAPKNTNKLAMNNVFFNEYEVNEILRHIMIAKENSFVKDIIDGIELIEKEDIIIDTLDNPKVRISNYHRLMDALQRLTQLDENTILHMKKIDLFNTINKNMKL